MSDNVSKLQEKTLRTNLMSMIKDADRTENLTEKLSAYEATLDCFVEGTLSDLREKVETKIAETKNAINEKANSVDGLSESVKEKEAKLAELTEKQKELEEKIEKRTNILEGVRTEYQKRNVILEKLEEKAKEERKKVSVLEAENAELTEMLKPYLLEKKKDMKKKEEEGEDYDDEQDEVPGEQDTSPDEYDEKKDMKKKKKEAVDPNLEYDLMEYFLEAYRRNSEVVEIKNDILNANSLTEAKKSVRRFLRKVDEAEAEKVKESESRFKFQEKKDSVVKEKDFNTIANRLREKFGLIEEDQE